MRPRALRWLFSGVALLMAACEPHERQARVAHVDGTEISAVEAAVELRGMLWRRGEAWDSLDDATRKLRRKEAVERCVEQLLLAGFAKPPAELPTAQAKAAEDSFQQFLKQFEGPDGWKRRLELQGLSEMQMRSRITAEVMQGSAIETWLAGQRKQSGADREREARTWFDQHRQELKISERANVSHCFLTGHDQEKPDRSAEIAELYRKVAAGETTFESLASTYSEDERSKKTGGKLGWIERDRIPRDLAERVFSVPLNEAAPPFRTRLGWHIILVHERQKARLPEFPEAKDEIMARMDSTWRAAAVKRLMEELRAKAKIVVDESEVQMLGPAAAGE